MRDASEQTIAAEGQDETLRRMAAAERYNAWLLERARPYLGGRVLDAGSGIGTFAERIAAHADFVVAAEPDPRFLDVLRRRFDADPKVSVAPVDATTVEGPFDSIVCFNVLEHIPDDAGALRRMREQLSPAGRLLLLVPAHPLLYGSTDRMLEHERRYSASALRRLLVENGYAVDVLRHVNPVGAAGWLVSARILRREQIPEGPLRLYDKLVPLFRALDALPWPFGLSLWAVARRP